MSDGPRVVPFTPDPSAPIDVLTELGAAERFARIAGDAVRYDHARGRWLLWDAHHWTPDENGTITCIAADLVREWQRDAVAISDHDQRARALKFTLALERHTGIANVLALAKDLPPLADAGRAFDVDPWLLGVKNGVVDLRTGTLRPGQRDDRITMQARAAFDPDAPCPRWTQLCAEVFGGDAAVIDFVQRAVGYSLTGDSREQCVFMGYGHGANGKSTFLTTLAHVLGDYAWTMPFATIELQQRHAIPNDLAALAGRRFVVASETNDGTLLNESRLKALTGGDPISARFLHAEFFTFEPVAKFWLAVNHLPRVRDDSHAFWRRMRVLPFLQTFDVDTTLADVLRAEAPGILAWAVQGTRAWQRDGLTAPESVRRATADYRRDSDVLDEFLATACERDDGAEVRGSEIYQHYQAWATRVGLTERERLSATAFGRKLSERFPRQHTEHGGVYVGLARRVLEDG
jgi:putative DNA primase/helicase